MRSWFASALALTASVGALAARQNMDAVLGEPPSIISGVIIEGNRRMSVTSIRELIPVRDGDAFDPAALEQAYRQLMATQKFSDVRFEWRDAVLVVRVHELGYVFSIRVEGNHRIETRTILSYVIVKAGEAIDQTRIDLSERALYDTGLFADVQIKVERGDLVVRVLENAIINRIVFEGNSTIDTNVLEEETEAAPRQTFTLSRIEQDVQRILDLYRHAGHFAATVSPRYKVLPENRVDLVFVIDEGPVTSVGSMSFVGNRAFSDDRLRDEIRTRQSRWWRFFERSDSYGAEQLEFDRAQLTSFYNGEGFSDFRITSSSAELTPDRRDLLVTFNLDEGAKSKPDKRTADSPRVYVERIDIQGDTRELDSVIRREIRTAQGDTYDPARLVKAAKRIRAQGFFNDARFNVAEFLSQGDEAPGSLFPAPALTWDQLQSAYLNLDQQRNYLGRGQYLKAAQTNGLPTAEKKDTEAKVSRAQPTAFFNTRKSKEADVVDLSKHRKKHAVQNDMSHPEATQSERDLIAALVAAGRQAIANNPLLDMYHSDEAKRSGVQ